jgi:alkanesulfonate monooxygenase SsuD/methylene tetrahydromethanopterin reductase-like flavin-dependent oxidoreductase (luciferase family)
LFGFDTRDYDALFAEKLELFLMLRERTHPVWEGRYRPALTGQGVFPRPHQLRFPVWLGVGGSPESFARAGTLGLPLMVAIIGGSFERFRPVVDLYRESGLRAGTLLSNSSWAFMRWASSEKPLEKPRTPSSQAGHI